MEGVQSGAREIVSVINEDGFTLHRRVWRVYRRLPGLLQIWIVLALAGALIFEVPSLLSGGGADQAIRAAVTTAVREATGTDPAASCSALSPAGLDQVIDTFGAAVTGSAPGADPLSACRQLAAQLRQQATPQQVADLAGGSVRSVKFQANGSALVLYVAADGRLAANFTLSETNRRWLIDSVVLGSVLTTIGQTEGG